MQVSAVPGRRINDSWPKKPRPGELSFPDALASEHVYRVTGKTMNEAEKCVASDAVLQEKYSIARLVRFRLFWWPNENNAGLLAVLQYRFPAANPPMACPSMGVLAHLVKKDTNWQRRDQYLLDTTHHDAIQRIELLDLAGNGAYDLVVESNFGGAATAGSALQVFDLSRGSFEELLNTNSRLENGMDGQLYTQSLDVARSLETAGRQLCFLKTTLIEKGKRLTTPRITRPCYNRGDGVDRAWVRDGNKMLAPLR